MDHHLGIGAGGYVEGYEDKYTFGRRANGFYIPRFRNVGNDKRDYLRGFGYQGSGLIVKDGDMMLLNLALVVSLKMP
jgi:hypothetical protein